VPIYLADSRADNDVCSDVQVEVKLSRFVS